MSDLRNFVRESNRIEGITRAPKASEVLAHEIVLGLDEVTSDDLARFVLTVARKPLREFPGMDVRVGNHIAPPGGPKIIRKLDGILQDVKVDRIDPYTIHHRYETLHPFMDGNGRSGRVLWLWQMIHQVRDPHVLSRGFLHTWYYQTLGAGR